MDTGQISQGEVYLVRFRKGSVKAPVFHESEAFVEEQDGRNAWIVTRLDSPERVRVLADQILARRGGLNGSRGTQERPRLRTKR